LSSAPLFFGDLSPSPSIFSITVVFILFILGQHIFFSPD
jgi:hypothetical protein